VPEPALEIWLEATRAWTEAALSSALAQSSLGPERHAEALRYALLGGGKRLRPALVRMMCAQLGGDDDAARAPAVAIEMVHTYSLVHDDLPCMDDDELRRGRPTCHVVFGEAEAVLVGDSLLTLAFETLATCGHPSAAPMVAALARGAGPAGMVGGQSLDVAGEAGAGLERVRAIHRAKTAALVSTAAELGGLAAGASESQLQALRGYGQALGLCFQAVDDVLDVVGDAATLGKTPGKDAADGKATLVETLGLEGAREEARGHAERARECARTAGSPEGGPALALVDFFLARTT
jgi:geranylgeranyl diphosphate synthase, type II